MASMPPLRGVAGVLDPAGGRGSSDNFEQGYYQASAFLATLGRNLVRSPGTPLGGVTRRLAFHLALLRSVASSCHLAQFELVPVAEDRLLLISCQACPCDLDAYIWLMSEWGRV